MRKFTAILLAYLFLFQSAGKLIVIINYSINKVYISTNLCENKAKPALKCNGKCHLRKQLQKEDKKENTPANNLKDKFEVQFISELQNIKLQTNENKKVVLNVKYNNRNYDKHTKDVYHPPKA